MHCGGADVIIIRRRHSAPCSPFEITIQGQKLVGRTAIAIQRGEGAPPPPLHPTPNCFSHPNIYNRDSSLCVVIKSENRKHSTSICFSNCNVHVCVSTRAALTCKHWISDWSLYLMFMRVNLIAPITIRTISTYQVWSTAALGFLSGVYWYEDLMSLSRSE